MGIHFAGTRQNPSAIARDRVMTELPALSLPVLSCAGVRAK